VKSEAAARFALLRWKRAPRRFGKNGRYSSRQWQMENAGRRAAL